MTVSQKEQSSQSLREKLALFLHSVKTDFPAALGMMSDDIRWINLLPDHIPFAGEFCGHEGVIHYFQLMDANFVLGDHHFDEYEFIETHDTLVVIGCEKNGKVVPTGKVFDLEFVWIVRFDADGKICYLREHNDTAAIGEAFLP